MQQLRALAYSGLGRGTRLNPSQDCELLALVTQVANLAADGRVETFVAIGQLSQPRADWGELLFMVVNLSLLNSECSKQ